MSESHSLSDELQEVRRRWREWVPGASLALALLVIGDMAGRPNQLNLWFDDDGSFFPLIGCIGFTGAFCSLMWMTCQCTQPPAQFQRNARILTAVFFGIVALKAGGRFAHLCSDGSPVIEGLAILGTPALVIVAVFACKRRGVGALIATSLIVAVWMLARIYLDWAHGN